MPDFAALPTDTTVAAREERPLDRRARNKERTRQGLAVAAVDLFAAKGYEATSVDEIADRAGVSPRTFFRYFKSKDDVLIPVESPFETTAAILSQPPDSSDLDAIRGAFIELAPEFAALRGRLEALRRALSSSVTLRGRNFDQNRNAEHQIARALAERRGCSVDDQIVLAATIGFAVVRRATERWLDGPTDAELAPIVDEAFVALEQLHSS